MMDDFRTQVYNTLRLKENDELIEIWERNDRVEWSELAFEVIREILQERLGEIPPQDKPVYEHLEQDANDEAAELHYPKEESTYNFEEIGVKIEFEGFYSKDTVRKKTPLRKSKNSLQNK